MSLDNSNSSWKPLNKKRFSSMFKLGAGTNTTSSDASARKPDEQYPTENILVLDATLPPSASVYQPTVSSSTPLSPIVPEIQEHMQKKPPNLLRKARNLSRILNGISDAPTLTPVTGPPVDASESTLLPSDGVTTMGSLRSKDLRPVINGSMIQQQPSPSDDPSVPSVRLSRPQDNPETLLPPLSTGSTTDPSDSLLVQQLFNSYIITKSTPAAHLTPISASPPVPPTKGLRADQPTVSCEDYSSNMLLSIRNIPNKTRQTAEGRKHDRRRSLDPMSLRAMMTPQPFIGGHSPLQQDKQEKPKPKTLKRSRSLWLQKSNFVQENACLESALDARPSTMEPISERQRFINVRRARKLNQVFGTEPPLTLFQMGCAINEEEVGLGNRDSMTTIMSLYEGSIASIPSPTQNRRHSLAPSTASFRTAAEQTPPSSATSPVFAAGDGRLSPHRSHLTSLVRAKSERGRYNESGYPGYHSSPSSLPHGSFSQAENNTLAKTHLRESLAEDFHIRRRRAVKLSKFFGVGYQDLTTIYSPSIAAADHVGFSPLESVSPPPSAATTTALLAGSRPTSPLSNSDRDPIPVTSFGATFANTYANTAEDDDKYLETFSRPQSPPIQVQIKTANRFWGIIGIGSGGSENNVAVDATYEDVIERLRGLKAS